MHMVGRHGTSHDAHLPRLADLAQQVAAAIGHVPFEHGKAVLGHPDQVVLEVRDAVSAVVVLGHPQTITPPPNALKANRLKTVGLNRVAGN